MSYLNLSSIRECTESEGPGKRFAIWCQGCLKRCPGCCNPKMQELRKNHIVDAQDIAKMILDAKNKYGIEGVSFIGGEPTLQAKGFQELAKLCHENDLSVLLFTGYYYEELQASLDEDIIELIKNCDIIVDGPFIQEQLDTERDWVGSKNQNVIFVSDRYSPGVETRNGERSIDVLINAEQIMINGWPTEKLLD